jgi:KDEL-tailed cysteine endopeptidase
VWEQGACGGCWAFTTTTAMEGIHYIWTREKTALSPQMLLECDPLDNDCAGGNMVTGFQYAVMKGGVAAEANYDYNDYTRDTGAVGPCRENTARLHAVSIDDYIIISNTWLDLKAAVLMQPVSVAVNAMSDAFKYYSGGILTFEHCKPDYDGEGLINHAVSAIGFGVDDTGLEYLIIKNSWGTDWGEGGFAKISMEGGEMNATCGLLVETVAPLKYSNETYLDPKYDPDVEDFVDWVPKTPMFAVSLVGGGMYSCCVQLTHSA